MFGIYYIYGCLAIANCSPKLKTVITSCNLFNANSRVIYKARVSRAYDAS